jgi:hypothetical protein
MTATAQTVLPRSDRGRSARRPRWLLVVVLLLATVIGAAGVAGRGPATVPLAESVGAAIAAAGPPNASPPARLQWYATTAMLFPTSGPETRWTQGLGRFVSAVRHASLRSCVRSHGVPMPLVPPPMFGGFYDIPDLGHIRDHGFSQSTKDPDPHPDVSASAVAVQKSCVTASRQSVQGVQALYASLQAKWLGTMASLGTDPDVVAAYRTLPACLARHAVRAADEQSFFAVLAARMRSVVGKPGAERVERELATHYATCMAPIESVRVAKRLELRRAFLAEHAADVEQVRLVLLPQLEQLQRTSGVQLVYPTG